jgi:hypothetical protein
VPERRCASARFITPAPVADESGPRAAHCINLPSFLPSFLPASGCSNAQPEHPKLLRLPEVDARVCLDPLRKKVETAAWERAPPASRAMRSESCDCRRSGFTRLQTSSYTCRPPQRTAWPACAPSLHQSRRIALRAKVTTRFSRCAQRGLKPRLRHRPVLGGSAHLTNASFRVLCG